MSNPESNIFHGLELLFSKVLTDINQENITNNKKVFINDIKNFDNLNIKLNKKFYFQKLFIGTLIQMINEEHFMIL